MIAGAAVVGQWSVPRGDRRSGPSAPASSAFPPNMIHGMPHVIREILLRSGEKCRGFAGCAIDRPHPYRLAKVRRLDQHAPGDSRQ